MTIRVKGRRRPLVLLKKQPSWGLGQRVSGNTMFITGGGRLTGPQLVSGATVDEGGIPNPNQFTVCFNDPVSVVDPDVGVELLIDGVPATFAFAFKSPDNKCYTYNRPIFVWQDGEQLIFNLDNSSETWLDASNNQPIKNGSVRVENLYNSPVINSAIVNTTDPAKVDVLFDQDMQSPVLGADVGVTIGSKIITPIASGVYGKLVTYTIDPPFVADEQEDFVYTESVGDLEREDTSVSLKDASIPIVNNYRPIIGNFVLWESNSPILWESGQFMEAES